MEAPPRPLSAPKAKKAPKIREGIARSLKLFAALKDEFRQRGIPLPDNEAEFHTWLAVNPLALSLVEARTAFKFLITPIKADSRPYLLRKLATAKGEPSATRQSIPDMELYWVAAPVGSLPLNCFKLVDGVAKRFNAERFLADYPVNRAKNLGRMPKREYTLIEAEPFFLHPNLDAKSAEWQSSLAQALVGRVEALTIYSKYSAVLASDTVFLEHIKKTRQRAKDRRGHDTHVTTVQDEIQRKRKAEQDARLYEKRQQAYRVKKAARQARGLSDSDSDDEDYFHEDADQEARDSDADYPQPELEEARDGDDNEDGGDDNEDDEDYFISEWEINLMDRLGNVIDSQTQADRHPRTTTKFECNFSLDYQEYTPTECIVSTGYTLSRTRNGYTEVIRTKYDESSLTDYPLDQARIEGSIEYEHE